MLFFRKNKKSKAQKYSAVAGDKSASHRDDFFSTPLDRTRHPLSSEPEAVIDASAPAPEAMTEPASVIQITDLSQLVTGSGKPTRAIVAGDWFAFGANQIGISTVAIPASEGEEFLATAVVATLNFDDTEEPAQFGFGPMFFDAEGNVVGWYGNIAQPAKEPSELRLKKKAPSGSVAVKLVIRGPRTETANESYTLGVRELVLERR